MRPSGGLGLVNGGEGAAVDHRSVQAPVDALVGGRVGQVEAVDVAVLEALQAAFLGQGAHRTAQLSVAAGYQRALGHHGKGVLQHRMGLIGLGQLALVQRDGPLDAQLGVGQVHEGAGLLQVGGPVGVHQVV